MKYTTLLLDADDTMFDFQVCEYNALKNTIEGEGRIFTQELFETYDRINSALWRKLELGQVTRSRKLSRARLEKTYWGYIFIIPFFMSSTAFIGNSTAKISKNFHPASIYRNYLL